MPEPILIVHGVANRDRARFEAQAQKLQRQLSGDWQLVPVFWGDLGGQADDVLDVIPVMDAEVRGLGDARELPPGLLEQLFAMGASAAGAGEGAFGVRSDDEREAQILRGVERTQPAELEAVRSAEGDPIAEAVREQLPQTRFLRHVQDPALLQSIGQVLGESAGSATAQDAGGPGSGVPSLVRSEEPLPGWPVEPGLETRGLFDGIKRKAKKVLAALDEMIGKTVGDVLGHFNQRLRGAVAEPFVRFFGDIFAYQRNQDRIQARLWEAIADWEQKNHAAGSGYGTEARPMHVIAHSLGGLVCFDAAVRADKPLHMKSFLTFGSQPAFFHVIDQRQTLSRYRHGAPVTLPATIKRWTSLWDTMDFLAFTAGTAFQFPDGSKPRDIRVNDPISLLVSEKGWTHSIYWETEELAQALQEILAGNPA